MNRRNIVEVAERRMQALDLELQAAGRRSRAPKPSLNRPVLGSEARFRRVFNVPDYLLSESKYAALVVDLLHEAGVGLPTSVAANFRELFSMLRDEGVEPVVVAERLRLGLGPGV